MRKREKYNIYDKETSSTNQEGDKDPRRESSEVRPSRQWQQSSCSLRAGGNLVAWLTAVNSGEVESPCFKLADVWPAEPQVGAARCPRPLLLVTSRAARLLEGVREVRLNSKHADSLKGFFPLSSLLLPVC